MGGSFGINSHYVDEGLDAIMSRTHKNPPIDENRNIEKRLEPSHVFYEEDEIPYHLSPVERKKLKIKKNIWRREHLLQETKRSIDENTPAFIRDNFHPSPQQLRTLEQSLSPLHLEPRNLAPHPRENESPAQDRPTRYHTVANIGCDPRIAEAVDVEALKGARFLLAQYSPQVYATPDDIEQYDSWDGPKHSWKNEGYLIDGQMSMHQGTYGGTQAPTTGDLDQGRKSGLMCR
jgi:hypothetical protein